MFQINSLCVIVCLKLIFKNKEKITCFIIELFDLLLECSFNGLLVKIHRHNIFIFTHYLQEYLQCYLQFPVLPSRILYLFYCIIYNNILQCITIFDRRYEQCSLSIEFGGIDDIVKVFLLNNVARFRLRHTREPDASFTTNGHTRS